MSIRFDQDLQSFLSPNRPNSLGSDLNVYYLDTFGTASITPSDPKSYTKGTCTACDTGKYGILGSCLACEAGKYSTSGAASCFECDAGKYRSSDTSPCLECDAGKYSPSPVATSPRNCFDCNAGRYSSSPGANLCQACKAGKYSKSIKATSDDVCIDCSLGESTLGESGKLKCTECPSGLTSNDQETCMLRECESDEFNNNGKCEKCNNALR